jgi:hypothetical protein
MASARLCPTVSGTATGCGPWDTTMRMTVSGATIVPEPGSVRITSPSGTVELYSATWLGTRSSSVRVDWALS